MFQERGREMQQDPFSPEMPGHKPEMNLATNESYTSAVEDFRFGMVNETKIDDPNYLRGFADKINDKTLQSEIRRVADSLEGNPNQAIDFAGIAKQLKKGIN